MGRLPSKSGGAAYRRLHRHLLRPVIASVIINNAAAATTSANERYVRRAPVCVFSMFCEYMLCYCLFPIILLLSISSMFELHVVVATFVMFNILKLIIEIVPNFPTFSGGLRAPEAAKS
jgi:Na+-driven multidrug efflux pump